MKILLANTPWHKEGFYGVRAGCRWPHLRPNSSKYYPFPFFLAYTAAILEQNDVDVLLIDAIAERMSNKKFLKKVSKFDPDIILLEVSTLSIDIDLDWARKLKEQNKKLIIVFAGIHSNMFESSFLYENKDVNFIIKGEYEYSFLELVKELRNCNAPNYDDHIDGLIYRIGLDDNIKHNDKKASIENLDDLPWPARHFLPMEKYAGFPGKMPIPNVQIWSSRGCPYKCNFCIWPQLMYKFGVYRARNPIKVVDEMEYLVKKKDFKSVYFSDDVFNVGKERVLKICSEIIKRNIKVPFAIMARADLMDKEMLIALKKAGLVAIKYGVESASQKILNNCGKRLDIKKAKEAIKLTKELGIKIHLTFMFGLPGENYKTVQKTLNLSESLEPESLQFSIATPLPGTKFYKEVEEKGFLTSTNLSEYDGNTKAVIRTEELTSENLEYILSKAKYE